jgi:hypothetical protein
MKKENIRILLKCYKYCERSKGENLKRVKKMAYLQRSLQLETGKKR